MGEETAVARSVRTRGGGKLRRGADGRLRFRYNPCVDPASLELPEDTIDRAIGQYVDLLGERAGDVALMMSLVESRGELGVVQELFHNLARGGDDAVTAFTCLEEAIKLTIVKSI